MKSMNSANKPDALANCDNTSDAAKPVSTAQQTAFGHSRLHFPSGQQVANLTAATGLTAQQCICVYLGRAKAAITSVTIRCRVTTAYSFGFGGVPWAEAAIYKGDPVLGAAAALTRVGFLNVGTVINSTGLKSLAVTVSGVTAGGHLWALVGSDGGGEGTVAQFRGCLADDIRSGQYNIFTARPSTTSSPAEVSLLSAAVVPPWFAIGW